MKKKTSFLIAALLILSMPLHGDDYQYQHFADRKWMDRYVPFSDYIPRIRMHYYTHPHYLEDYYRLYGMKLYYNENSLRMNIVRLKTALNCKFRHPSQALVKVETEKEYLKYRKIMFMHINILIMKSYIRIGTRYDKKRIYFYDKDFAKDISESLKIADSLYREAIPYWNKAKRLASEASRIKITTKLSNIESERFTIMTKELNYGRTINRDLKKLKIKQARLQNYLATSAK